MYPGTPVPKSVRGGGGDGNPRSLRELVFKFWGLNPKTWSNGIFVPDPDISILLFYTHERFPLQKNAKSEETNCCLLLI